MINTAILGFGVVGGGVAELLKQNAASIERTVGETVNVKYILDLRNFPDSPWNDRIVHDINIILSDPDVALVVEAMGGSHPAFDFSIRAMEAGKHVVTSNKEVVANYGDVLLETAEKNNVYYMFEASVGGGIPVIRNVRGMMATETINKIIGILNGTTNYILTEMEKTGVPYEVALSEAKSFGYAEANPSADVDGIDAQRKICILTALATGKLIKTAKINAETMRKITLGDIDAAKRMNGAVKLIGYANIENDGVEIAVFPAVLPFTNPLAHIKDVYNGILVTAELTGDVMFYGRGAGRYPTAGAIIADIVSVLSGEQTKIKRERWQPAPDNFTKPFVNSAYRRYIRVKNTADISVFGKFHMLENSPAGTLEIITPELSEYDFTAMTEQLPDGEVISALKIF